MTFGIVVYTERRLLGQGTHSLAPTEDDPEEEGRGWGLGGTSRKKLQIEGRNEVIQQYCCLGEDAVVM